MTTVWSLLDPLDLSDFDSVSQMLYTIDCAVQFGEDSDVRTSRYEDMHEEFYDQTEWPNATCEQFESDIVSDINKKVSILDLSLMPNSTNKDLGFHTGNISPR